ncbi:MAG: Stp1/IreP family PP2C-type Ser/Thr phosphatase [Ruminococcaceae bacterium]|nr:Stp1/IreP family PP2C-type Ser/Thr phosphatase [Oscillospiraceae bacterium]
MNIHGKTDKGILRHSNQDAFSFGTFEDGAAWAVVCDGMGGANGGNIASEMAVENLSASLQSGYRLNMTEMSIKNLLTSAVNAANVKVFCKAREDVSLAGMGTTVVAVLILGNTAYIAHAGDSRAYVYSDGRLLQLTRDHSIVQRLVEEGNITWDEAKVHPRKNVITRALGVEESVEVEFTVADLPEKASLLICTDGLTNYTSNEELIEILSSEPLETVTERLIEAANNNGGGDNITAVVIDTIH